MYVLYVHVYVLLEISPLAVTGAKIYVRKFSFEL